MLSKFLGITFVQRLFLLGYTGLAIGLPLNKIVLSLATLLVALLTILNFDLSTYREHLKKNKAIQILLLFITFHLLSFFWSDNTAYFLKDLNAKLPFYAIPIVFVLNPLQKRTEVHFIFAAFLASLFLTSIINFFIFYLVHDGKGDIRQMSLFLSHIRYGLMLIFGMVLCFYWLISSSLKLKVVPLLLIVWWLIYTYFSEVFSAYLTLIPIILLLGLLYIKKLASSILKKVILTSIIAVLGTFVFVFIYYFFVDRQTIPVPKEHERTKLGNVYSYDSTKTTTINGTPVYTYVCGIELKQEWAKRSNRPIFEKNPSGFENYYILIQYLASKGFLKKDAETFALLNHKDIHQIENGINNCCPEKNVGFVKRLKTLREEIYEPDPNGKTIRQRLEYLKAGSSIFKNSPVFGIGSGDLEDEFQDYYEKEKSHLKKENRLRTHNQIITYFVSFGLIGGMLFILFLWISFHFFVREKLNLAFLFLLILVISFLSEDTLETQMGATFFGLFYGLFISTPKPLYASDEN